MRSFLRLGRSGLGKQNYQDFNVFYRDRSRALSQLRDVTALIETLTFFIKTRRSNSARSFLLRFKRDLDAKRRQQLQMILSGNIMAEVIRDLECKGEEINSWQLTGDAAEVFSTGAKRIYSRGKKLFKSALLRPDSHNMHEWRKQVKYFWYHLLVLSPIWPGVMLACAKEVQHLSQLLGKHHDLVMLENAIAELRPASGQQDIVYNLKKSIRVRKKRIEQKCFALGSKIYAEKPGALAEKLKVFWISK